MVVRDGVRVSGSVKVGGEGRLFDGGPFCGALVADAESVSGCGWVNWECGGVCGCDCVEVDVDVL